MDFRLMALNIQQFTPMLSIPVIKQRINVRYRQILGQEDWTFLNDHTIINLVAAHSNVTGDTVAVAVAGVNVTGTGTTFTNWQADDRMRFGSESQPYIVSTVSNNTGLTIEIGYGGSTALSGEDYELFRTIYTPAAGDVDTITGVVYQSPLQERSQAYLNALDPERTSRGEPSIYSVVSKTRAHGLVTIEIWPVSDAAYTVTVAYKKLVGLLSANTDEPVFRADVLEAGALWDCYRQAFAVTQNPAWMGLARDAKVDYAGLLDQLSAEELRTASMPAAVRDVSAGGIVDDDYFTKHDINPII